VTSREPDGVTGTVVVVGSVNADLVLRVERRPRPGETVGNATIEFHHGGKGANQAVAAARCGASVAMVGRVGNDPYGDSQRAALADDAVDVSHVSVSQDVPTGLAVVMVTPDGENSIVVAPGTNHDLTPEHVAAASSVIAHAKVLAVQLEIPVRAVERAVGLAAKGAVVVVNFSPITSLPGSVLTGTTVLVANEVEAAALSGRPADTPGDAFEAASRIVEMGPRCAVITLGPLGAVLVDGGEQVHVPAEKAAVVDTTGAGDAFVGALAAALSKGRGIEQAVRFGVAVGSATTTKFGARAIVPPGLAP
jgi:ribokinase